MRHLLVLLLVIYVGSTFVAQYVKLWQLSHEELEVKGQLEKALEEKDMLQKEIELLHTDEYIEKVARDELGLVKPGEYIFRTSKTLK